MLSTISALLLTRLGPWGPSHPQPRGLGSHSPWRMTLPLPAMLRNSHRNGGGLFLIFVADPRTEGDAPPSQLLVGDSAIPQPGGCGSFW
jgi:hypothetical protein